MTVTRSAGTEPGLYAGPPTPPGPRHPYPTPFHVDPIPRHFAGAWDQLVFPRRPDHSWYAPQQNEL